MKPVLLVLVSLCVFAAAMVPRHRQASDTEEHHPTESAHTESGADALKTICAATTPCAWSTYNPVSKILDFTINNTYCTCGEGLLCQVDEDDVSSSAFVYRCSSPKPQLES